MWTDACILRVGVVAFVLKNTLFGHVFMHLQQPMQASGFLNITCRCHRKPVFPITFRGQFFIHFQHAVHWYGFMQTYAVAVLFIFIAVTFCCKVKQ